MVWLGYALVVLGIVSSLVAIFIQWKASFGKEAAPKGDTTLPDAVNAAGVDLDKLKDVIKELSGAFEQFGKLGSPVQWAFIGLAQIWSGVYILMNV